MISWMIERHQGQFKGTFTIIDMKKQEGYIYLGVFVFLLPSDPENCLTVKM